MRRREALGVAAGGLLWARCSGSAPGPTPTPPPTPTPTPTPEPTIAFPLHVEGHQFIDAAGRAIPLLGAVVCCGDKAHNGWPLISDAALTELHDHRATWTHIRLGPFHPRGPDGDTSPISALGHHVSPWSIECCDADGYGLSSERSDLDISSGTFWPRVRRGCGLALQFGKVMEVDCIDGWVLKKENRGDNYSYYGWDGTITQRRPDRQQEQWLIQVCEQTREFPNVVYQTSNEGFIAAPGLSPSSREWEWGVRDIVRHHAPGHLISTNNHQADVERGFDYVNRHQEGPVLAPLHGKPTAVNEHGPDRPPDVWEQHVHTARQSGTIMHGWRGELPEAGWQDLLDRMERLQVGG